jgi:hypothetical protein
MDSIFGIQLAELEDCSLDVLLSHGWREATMPIYGEVFLDYKMSPRNINTNKMLVRTKAMGGSYKGVLQTDFMSNMRLHSN